MPVSQSDRPILRELIAVIGSRSLTDSYIYPLPQQRLMPEINAPRASLPQPDLLASLLPLTSDAVISDSTLINLMQEGYGPRARAIINELSKETVLQLVDHWLEPFNQNRDLRLFQSLISSGETQLVQELLDELRSSNTTILPPPIATSSTENALSSKILPSTEEDFRTLPIWDKLDNEKAWCGSRNLLVSTQDRLIRKILRRCGPVASGFLQAYPRSIQLHILDYYYSNVTANVPGTVKFSFYDLTEEERRHVKRFITEVYV